MNKYTTTITKTIDMSLVDFKGQYRTNLLLNEFTNVATKNAEALNMWHKDMYGKYGWVIAKQTLILDEPIHLNDTIEISTLPAKGSFVSFPRYYFINKNGQQIGTCSSLWTLIDLEKRMIVSPKKIGLDFPNIQHDIKLPLPKINHYDQLNFISKRKVVYEDIDTNGHMNNTRHISWAMDLINIEYLKQHTLHELTIQYKKELAPNTMVDQYMYQDQDLFVIEGRVNGETYYSLELKFKLDV